MFTKSTSNINDRFKNTFTKYSTEMKLFEEAKETLNTTSKVHLKTQRAMTLVLLLQSRLKIKSKLIQKL